MSFTYYMSVHVTCVYALTHGRKLMYININAPLLSSRATTVAVSPFIDA